MAAINFYLRDNKSDKETPIVLYLSYNGQRIKVPTGEKIHPKNWNSKKQCVRSSVCQAMSLNQYLKRISEKMIAIFRELKSSDRPQSPSLLRNRFERFLKEGDDNVLDFHQFVQEHILQTEKMKSPTIAARYKIHYQHLLQYEKHDGNRIDFEDIDLKFYEAFKHFIIIKTELAENTFGSIIKTLKSFLNAATDQGHNKNFTFRHKKFKRIDNPTHAIYLTITELEKIYSLDLSKTPKLEETRDAFIIGCYTGLRFSDFIRLENHHFIEGPFIQIVTQKTGGEVVIPMHPFVQAIREKYKLNSGQPMPKKVSNTTMNKRLKEIGRLAGIHTPIIQRNSKDFATKKKYELIMTHTARRSFATNAFLAGIPAISIMKITDHKSERSFMRYIKISQLDNANKLARHPFFSPNNKIAS